MRAFQGEFTSIPQQSLQIIPRLVFTSPIFRRRHKLPSDHFKVFAVISQVFFRHGIRAAVPALFSDPGVIAHAV